MSRLSRLANVFRAARVDRDLDDELRFHLEARAEDLISNGVAPDAATVQAHRRLGNRLRLRESSREIKLLPRVDSLLQDARFGLRMLRKNRLLAAAAILSLSLAIGASAGAFSVLDALVLRPFPVPEPDRLISLTYSGPGRYGDALATGVSFFSYPMFERLRDAGRGKVDLFGLTYGGPQQLAVFDGASGADETIRTQWISGGGLTIAGITPALGRFFTKAEDRVEDGPSVAVLSYDFWMRHFGGNPGVLGQGLTLTLREMQDGRRFRIVGVGPKGFTGLEVGQPTDLWFPMSKRFPARFVGIPYADYFFVLGRLKPGVSAEQAIASLRGPFTEWRHKWAATLPNPRADAAFLGANLSSQSARSTSTNLRTQFTRPLWMLAVIVGLVLLIACSNVANLFIARAAARDREMGLRISIGAGRGRLIQQVLIESALVVTGACILGLALAYITAPGIVRLMGPSDFPAYLDVHPNGRLLGFLTGVGLLTTLLFGLAPALRASAVSPNTALKSGTDRQSPKRGIMRPLLAAQVGFSFVVLFMAGLLLLSFHNLTHVDPGFSKDGIILCTLRTRGTDEPPGAALSVLESLRKLPYVQSAGLSEIGLMGGEFSRRGMRIRLTGRESNPCLSLKVSPGFLETMQIGLLQGRQFVASDADRDVAPVIVNQAFASKYFPAENPLGKRFDRLERSTWTPQEIVGVVRSAKYNTLRDSAMPVMYVPMLQIDGATLQLRVSGDAGARAAALKAEIRGIDPSIRVTSVILQSTRIDNTLLKERLLALLAGFFAVVAVILAAVGLFGVLNYSVVERTKELGIRMALGARQSVVIRLVMADILLMTAIGIAGGIAGGLALARFQATILYGVSASDFVSFALPLACLLVASGLAALPALARAVRVDPIVALRHD